MNIIETHQLSHRYGRMEALRAAFLAARPKAMAAVAAGDRALANDLMERELEPVNRQREQLMEALRKSLKLPDDPVQAYQHWTVQLNRALTEEHRKAGIPKREARTQFDRPAERRPLRRDYDQYEDQPYERPRRDDFRDGPAPRRPASRRTPSEMTRLWLSVGAEHGIAPGDVVGCILGETGTGKELIARALHDRSEQLKIRESVLFEERARERRHRHVECGRGRALEAVR